MTKEERKQQKEEKFQKELDTPVLVWPDKPRTTIRELFNEHKPVRIHIGRRVSGMKIKTVKGERAEVLTYKQTAFEVELSGGWNYRISKFLASELKRREGLSVCYFNKW